MENPIVQKIFVEQNIATVWDAITNKEKLKEWYFDVSDFKLEENAEFEFYEPGGQKKYHHLCKILQVKLQSVFKHTWTYPDFSPNQSIVTWSLQAHNDNGTEIALIHEQTEGFKDLGKDFQRESFQGGWKEILENLLKNYLDKNQ